ncbi:MAG: hypothetical protein J6A08_03445 [Lachnospiraceae bacterium]|nr:hypothetical protein [Lachnospiraceae bacterium]
MKKQIEGQLNLFDYITEIVNLYEECIDCWCRDCRHNEELAGEPRDFAGERKPCPACSFCKKSGKAEICEINSYDNGCKLRAMEEGIE